MKDPEEPSFFVLSLVKILGKSRMAYEGGDGLM